MVVGRRGRCADLLHDVAGQTVAAVRRRLAARVTADQCGGAKLRVNEKLSTNHIYKSRSWP
jgi:hypothetical protein